MDIILQYHIHLWYDIECDIRYDIMTSVSLCSAATLGSAGSSSCLTVSLPSLSCPGPALADTLAPDPPSLCNGHHPGVTPAVAPHPDVHLVEPAAVTAPVPLHVGRGASKARIVLEVMWNSGVTVAADEAQNKGGVPQHFLHRCWLLAES